MRRALVLFAVTIAIVAVETAGAQLSLSNKEREIAHIVDVNNRDALVLLERIVNMNSGSMNFDGVREVGMVFKSELDALGFDTRWVDGTPFNRSGHLFGTRRGKGPHLLLIGHLDTVFEKDSPFQKFEKTSDTTANGPGIVDMKGGNVIIIYVLKALEAAGVLDKVTITVAYIGDEERVGDPVSLARADLIAAAKEADITLAFENGDNDTRTAVVSRRGSTSWRLQVQGTPAHSSQIFRDGIGYGAIFEVSRILNAFREEMSGEKHLTFNPGMIIGGTSVDYDSTLARGDAFGKGNVIAEHVVATGDLRAVSPKQLADAKSRMRRIVSDNLNGTSAEISFRDKYPPMAPTDGNNKLLSILDEASRALGLGAVAAVDPSNAGAADVAFTAEWVDMAIDGLGLMGADCHAVGEMADLTTLPSHTKRAAVLIHRLSRWKSR